MNLYIKPKLLSTVEKIKYLERKLFDQSQAIDEMTKTFDKLFSTNKSSKFCGRQTSYADGITQIRGEIFLQFYFFYRYLFTI